MIRRRLVLVGALLATLTACQDGFSLGLAGCNALPGVPFTRTPQNTVAHGVHATVTAAGADFLIAQRETLVGLLFDVGPDGRVVLDLPMFDFGSAGGLGVGVRDLAISFDLRAVGLDLQFLPDPTRVRVSITNARLKLDDGVVWVSVGGDAACRLGNGVAVGQPGEALVVADIAFDIALRVDEQGRFQAEVTVLPFTIHELNFELLYDDLLPECADGITAAECRVACSAGDTFIEIVEALYDALRERIDQLLQPVVESAVNALLGRFLERPLAFEGEVHPRVLADLLPTAADAHPIGFGIAPSPEGFTVRTAGDRGDGVGLTLDVGMDALEHPCVPPVGAPPLFLAGPAPALTGYDHEGRPYHAGLALSDAALNRALWVAYRAGVLCLALDSAQIEGLLGQRIDTSTLSLVLPGLAELARGPRPILLAIDPAFEPGDFPLATFYDVADDGGLPQAGIAIRLPHLGVSFYGFVEERWTRLFQGTVSVALGVTVRAGPDNVLALDVDAPQVEGLTETYNELLEGANLVQLLELVIDLATATLLQDGLSLDLGLDGLLSGLGLPVAPRIEALRVDGEAGDFLSVLTTLFASGGGAGLRVQADTEATLLRVEPGRADLRVRSPGLLAARFQWRLDAGPWRPLRAAPGGVLVVVEPRLRVLGQHHIEVRSVAEGDAFSLDPSPVELTLTIAPPDPAARGAPAPDGCNATPGAPPASGLGLLLLLALAGGRRRAKLGPVALVALVTLSLLTACGDRKAATEARCVTSSDCPGGLACFEGRCLPPPPCDTTADCCPGAECRAGACAALEAECEAEAACVDPDRTCAAGRCQRRPCGATTDCPDGATCAAGLCHRGPPCGGACAPDEVCYAPIDACRPAVCPISCDAGYVRVARDPQAHIAVLCDRADEVCDCVRAPPLVPADFGRYASMGLLNGRAVFAAYDADFGDLVYVEDVETGSPRVTYLDGVSADAPVTADPTGPRGGRVQPGPDRGWYARLAIDLKGRPQIVYYDADAGALRYLRADEDGHWQAPLVIDDRGDVGRYPRIAIDSVGGVHVIYTVVSGEAGEAGLRYAYAADGEPVSASDFRITDVSMRGAPSAPAPPGITPEAHGVMPCMRVGPDGRVYLAFYDGAERWPYLGRGDPATGAFEVHRLTGELAPDFPPDPGGRYARLAEHDLGRFCDLEPDFEIGVLLAFVDHTSNALLMYRGPIEGGGDVEMIDPGGRGIRRLVGADPALDLDREGRPVVVYQDATENDVLLAVRTEAGWAATPSVVASAGAMGFFNSLVVIGDEAVVGTLELATTATGRGDHHLHVFRTQVPAF